MKNAKVVLSVSAILFAIAGAFASRSIASQPGYERVDTGSMIQCVNQGECDVQQGPECKFRKPDGSLVELREFNSPTINCGRVLTHSQDGGVINPASE